jgi:hypothetical protein
MRSADGQQKLKALALLAGAADGQLSAKPRRMIAAFSLG